MFIGALVIFGNRIPQYLFVAGTKTSSMDNAEFPVISFTTGGQEINRLYGYASNIDEMLIRTCITPVTDDKTFEINITENDTTIKKLKYNLYDDSGNELENDSALLLEDSDGQKSVKITVSEPLRSGKEYILKITLITDTGKRIYYYSRLKEYDKDLLTEKLDFVQNFHTCLLEGRYEEVEKYLEPKKKIDNTSFAHVNIHSSRDLVTWGDLEPEIVYMELPTVSEYYEGMASIRLDYIVSVQTGSGHEYYRIKEAFRFNYTASRVYLYDYDRTMEAYFDPALTEYIRGEFKLGITDADDISVIESEDKKLVAFSYNGEAWVFNAEENELTRVFSFRNGNYTEMRDLIPEHGVRLMSFSEEGYLDFVAYGYMNRGEYEGRVGIILYRFYPEDNRMEEQAYIPVNCSYEQLCKEMTVLMCRNVYDKFIFAVSDTVYSYDISKKALTVIAENVPAQSLIYDAEKDYAAWQESADLTESHSIKIMNLTDGTILSVDSADCIQIFGSVEGNLVIGYSKLADRFVYADGTSLLPAYRLTICDSAGAVLKDYRKENKYITGISTEDHMIVISRLEKKERDGQFTYAVTEDDFIQNQNSDAEPAVGLIKRVINLTLTEYYLYYPLEFAGEEKPTNLVSRTTVSAEDTTVRINREEKRTDNYYTYSFGDLIFTSKSAGEAVQMADEKVGTVLDSNGRLVYERGIKSGKKELSGVNPVSSGGRLTSVQACLKTIAAYKNVETDATDFDKNRIDVSSWLASHIKAAPVNLTGASVSQVLYYTYKNRLVMAFLKDETAVLITAYDASSVTYYNPEKNKTVKVTLKEAEELFGEGGNRFYSYVD